MKKKFTDRGFSIINFQDSYGEECSLQESSNIIPHLWLGISNPTPKIKVRDILTDDNYNNVEDVYGWVDYPLPENVFISGRMHIGVKSAKELITQLQEFVDKNEG